jgi:hypothetical protein
MYAKDSTISTSSADSHAVRRSECLAAETWCTTSLLDDADDVKEYDNPNERSVNKEKKNEKKHGRLRPSFVRSTGSRLCDQREICPRRLRAHHYEKQPERTSKMPLHPIYIYTYIYIYIYMDTAHRLPARVSAPAFNSFVLSVVE